MFDSLSDKLDRAFKVLKGQGQVTEINVAETVKEIRRALLDADVSYKVAKQFTDTVKEKALGENVMNSVSPHQLMVKITHDELANLISVTASLIARASVEAAGPEAVPDHNPVPQPYPATC